MSREVRENRLIKDSLGFKYNKYYNIKMLIKYNFKMLIKMNVKCYSCKILK